MKLAVALFALLLTAQASGPLAVFALVDKVTFEPGAEKPERIVLHGVFSISSEQSPYSAPRKGYLYFSLPSGPQAAQALREWQDVKQLAGSHSVLGFGAGWSRNDYRVQPESEKPASPAPWPVNNNGLQRVNDNHPQAKALLEFKDK